MPRLRLALSRVARRAGKSRTGGSGVLLRNRIMGPALLMGVAMSGASSAPAQQSQDAAVVIENVTLISPERESPLAHAVVVIRNGRIAAVGQNLAVPPHARRIDGRERFLMPGLIDSHVHVAHSAALDDDAIDAHPELWEAYQAQVPRAYLAFGFTSVVDLDFAPATRAWFERGPMHPRLYSCGGGIKVAGGYMALRLPAPSSPSFPNLVYEPAEASHWPGTLRPADYTPAKAVERAVDAGAICVKAFVEPGFGIFNWPVMHTQTLRAIREATVARNLVLMVHANSTDSWRTALDAHANVIAHGLWNWPGDHGSSTPPAVAAGLIARAAREGVHVQPTMQVVAGERSMLDPGGLLDDPRLTLALPAGVIAYLRSPAGVKALGAMLEGYRKASPAPGFESLLRAAIERTHATFRMMLRYRVPLIFGSDSPGVDGFGNPPGLNGRLEMQDWADAGASPALILRAATLDNAIAMGLSRELGSVEVGKRADLLLLKENPLKSVAAYDSIETIFVNGELVTREALRPVN